MPEPTEAKTKKGVEITFGESERKPGERIGEWVGDIRKFSSDILEKVRAQSSAMRDDDKQILEERLANLRHDLMKISNELGEIEE